MKHLHRSLRPFAILWSGQAISLLGSQVVQFALVWWLTRETGSATVLTTATLVALLPQVFVGPLAGAVVDRSRRRLVMLVSDSVAALASALLAVLFLAGGVQPWHVFTLLFVRALCAGFQRPAMLASTSLMLPEEQLTRVQGFNQALDAGLGIVAAPVGAMVLGLLSMVGVMVIDLVTLVFGVLPLFFVAVPDPPSFSEREGGEQKADATPSLFSEILAGVRYLRARRGFLSLIAIAAVVNLVMVPAFALLPLLVDQTFGRDALDLAFMSSLFGFGGLAGGVLLAIWGGFPRRILTSLAGLVVAGVATIAIGATQPDAFWLALASMLVLGFSLPLINGPIVAIFQATVAADFQGRVFTLLASSAAAIAPIGLLVAGPLADAFGPQRLFTLAGIVCAAMGVTAFLTPSIVQIESRHRPPPNQEPDSCRDHG